MTLLRPHLPAGLARRFALAAAGLAAAAVVLISLASWWLANRQHQAALAEIAARERGFHAAAVSSDLTAVHDRMAEMAASSILATGLVDSAGKETYLEPFLNGVRQINGVPVQLLFTDFEGQPIAGNPGARFSPAQLAWLREQLRDGRPGARITRDGGVDELVAMQPLVYARTPSPEGALLYKVKLSDLHAGSGMLLDWAGHGLDSDGPATPVAVPSDFRSLGLSIRGAQPSAATAGELTIAPQLASFAVIGLALFAVVVLAGGRLAALLTADLRRLEGFAREVTGEGLTQRRVPETGSSEVRGLAATINRMLDRLQAQQQALAEEGRKQAALAAALGAADRRKDEFLAMLAHELRNPLAPIATGAQLLHQAAAGDERVARTSEVIARQAAHMAKLLDDLLDVSRVTRGLVTLEHRVLDLREVVRAAVDQVQPLLHSRGHGLAVRLPDAPVWVGGDAARLVQVVSNLLNNAAKYTPAQGEIEVTLGTQGGHAALRVADNGIGIPRELMPEIFDLFTQGTRSADRSQGGLGLGLALVRNLVELHHGSVRAESAGPDQGSVFTVTLPLVPAPEQPPVPTQAPAAPAGALRVLVVDDNR
ncbi:HAMP domain-containing histidine kinase, partial [Ramlibacter aquaticus]